jgi:hypothetical protein
MQILCNFIGFAHRGAVPALALRALAPAGSPRMDKASP